MLILGKNTDDVGAQLEKLTKRLLENRGYKNIATDTIGEGGNEIDVQAENPSRIPSSNSSRRLIAECKAWATPINLPDWLKFLGKVFVEEARLGNEVEALFVALSGVNGAVRGNFDSLRQRKQNVVLLEGELLTDELSKLYSLPQAALVAARLKQFTERQYSSMELAYYRDCFYWIFMFPDRDIAVLSANGEPADLAPLEDVKAKIVERLEGRNLIDLAAERLAVQRAKDAQKFLLTSLIGGGGFLPFSIVESEQSGFSAVELQSAFKQCETNGWIIRSNEKTIATSFTPQDKTDKLIETLRFLVAGTLKVADWSRFSGSKLFSDLLNENFSKQISIVQAGLVMEADFESRLRFLARISPSVLAHAINPDPMIVTGRINQPGVLRDEQEDCQRLMRSFLRELRHDFKRSELKKHFFSDSGLREIEVVEHYRVKDEKSVILEHEVKERTVIGQADESLGGGLLILEAFKSAPEPWDWLKPKPTTEGRDKSASS